MKKEDNVEVLRPAMSRQIMRRHAVPCSVKETLTCYAMSQRFMFYHKLSAAGGRCHRSRQRRCHQARLVILYDVTLCHIMLRHAMPRYASSRHATLCHVTPYCVMPRHAMPRYVTLRHVVLCHVTPKNVMPCCVTSCHVLSRNSMLQVENMAEEDTVEVFRPACPNGLMLCFATPNNATPCHVT